MNANDLKRILIGGKIVGEYFLKTNGPKAVEKSQKIIYHFQELVKSFMNLSQSYQSNTQDHSNSNDSSTEKNHENHKEKDLFGFSSLKNSDRHDKDLLSIIQNQPKVQMREREVPSTQFQRAMGFGGMASSIGLGIISDRIGNMISGNDSNQKISDQNAERLAEALCRLRGAALKIGQMLSIQDEEGMLPPALAKALERVRQSADYMPAHQLKVQMMKELGENWQEKFKSFEMSPIAAASIGQVHRASLHDGTDVVVKIQYPGVADSISSDLNNLKLLVSSTNLLPTGLFIDEIIKVARTELSEECNYTLELENQVKYKEFIVNDPFIKKHVYVPLVYRDYSSARVLTTEYIEGVSIDKAVNFSQDIRNAISRTLLYLTIHELFVYRFMQTDPNYSNFLYDHNKFRINLIDFGATRSYSKDFVDGYMKLVWAAANSDSETLIGISKKLGFLTGDESPEMITAHSKAGMVVGEPFLSNEPYDFSGSMLTTRIGQYGSVFMKHRLTPPPTEAYSLHRKLAGAFLLCIKLKACIPCRDILESVYKKYNFTSSS